MITMKDLLASGLSLELITAFNKMFEEFKKGKIGSLGLDKFILNNKLSIQQNRLIETYFMQKLWEKLVQVKQKDPNQTKKANSLLKWTLYGMAAPILVGFVLNIIGFGFRGVAAGSIAAVIHAFIGAARAGSLFAVSQSIGATGTLFSPAYIATGGAAGLANGIIQKEKSKKDWSICFRKFLPKL